MASWDRNFTGGSYAGAWHARLDYWVNWQDGGGNFSNISLRVYVWCDPGYSQSGLFVPRGRINGGEFGGDVNRTINNGSGMVLMASWDGNWGHDANGNLYLTIGDYCNAPINDMAWGDIGWSLPRIALAPSIAAATADTIKPTSVRFGTEINNYGHGTSAATRVYYRKQGDAAWITTSDQGDVGGYNYWTVTGLKPATTYEYFVRWWNNNGDTADSGVQTFKTKGIAGLAPLLMSVAR